MKKRNVVLRIIFHGLLAGGILLWAAQGISKPLHQFHRGIRPLGMGGAFTAVSDDENALFYNPAGLSDISMLNIGLINPIIEMSGDTWDFYGDASDADLDDTSETVDLLRDHLGEHQHFRLSLFPHVGFNILNMGAMVGGIGQFTLDSEIRNPTWPEAHLQIVRDVGLIGGVGAKLPLTGLRAGAALKIINRSSLDEVYTASDIADDDFEDRLEDDMKNGSGVALDLGAIYRVDLIPVVDVDVGLAIQNFPEMTLEGAKDLQSQVNLGFAVGKSFMGFGLKGALDFRDITNNLKEDDDFAKRIHIGVEAQFPVIFSARIGLNQGYPTAGISADFWLLSIDLATYTEEAGAHAGQRDDQRFAGQISFGW